MEYGLQLYSVRDAMEKNMELALREIAAMNYKFVEFAGFFGKPAKEVRSLLDKYGLYVSGTHSSAEGLLPENIDTTIEYHKALGCSDYIIPGYDFGTEEKLDGFIGLVNNAQPVLAENGIALHFHNHYTEFLPTGYGLCVHEELEKRTDIRFELDTYWAFFAGRDPVALIERLKDRITFIHLKDGDGGHGGRSLGSGVAPVREVLKKASELGFTVVVESESLDPDGLSEVMRCMDFLNSL